ncbi:MAG: hypothetical protein EOO09_11640 [Chitinophagaceae bacterium]|nr:MAG: hypothetical protein EOO09_11640 [Chitinophagaceae bacterium]
MKAFLPLLLLLSLAPSCKKAIEKKKENIIVSAMTSGQWKVASFVSNGTDRTAEFAGYSFKYYEDRTVDAINSGTVEKKGTWAENVDRLEILANFPSAANPILQINGNWKINRTDWTFVEATLVSDASTTTMRLEKI